VIFLQHKYIHMWQERD